MDSSRATSTTPRQHPGPDAYEGKQCVVIGSNNSAHDICAALWEAGAAEVTMVQRSLDAHRPLRVAHGASACGALYSEQAVAERHDDGARRHDLRVDAVPDHARGPDPPVRRRSARRDADLYDRLERAGFLLDFGDDGSGLFMKYLRRGSGYYIDVGASELVADGAIKLVVGAASTHLTEDAVVMADGTELPADLVVYATGYGSMNGWVADLISQDVADKVGKVWGLGSDTTKDPGPWEGEQRNMWKPTQQQALWFHGGNLAQSRHYSLHLALQLKARVEGIDDAGLRAAGGAPPQLTAGLRSMSAYGCLRPSRRRRIIAAFLASDEASYVTGALWSVDGGSPPCDGGQRERERDEQPARDLGAVLRHGLDLLCPAVCGEAESVEHGVAGQVHPEGHDEQDQADVDQARGRRGKVSRHRHERDDDDQEHRRVVQAPGGDVVVEAQHLVERQERQQHGQRDHAGPQRRRRRRMRQAASAADARATCPTTPNAPRSSLESSVADSRWRP